MTKTIGLLALMACFCVSAQSIDQTVDDKINAVVAPIQSEINAVNQKNLNQDSRMDLIEQRLNALETTVPVVDSDGDGIPDADDACPNDPTNTCNDPLATAQSYVDAGLPIPAGTYTDGIVVTANADIDLAGVYFQTSGDPNGKGKVLVTGPVNVTLRNAVIENPHIWDDAGLRVQLGASVTLLDSVISNQLMGVLTGNGGGIIRIEGSTIADSVNASELSHNVYIGFADEFWFVNSTAGGNKSLGHSVKSRAKKTYIHNSTVDQGLSSSSRVFDFPCGGYIEIKNSTMVQSPNSDNQDLMSVSVEASCRTPNSTLVLENTTWTAQKSGAIFLKTFDQVDIQCVGSNVFIGVADPCPAAPALDSDGDGVIDDIDQCPNTPAGTVVDSSGCVVTTAQGWEALQAVLAAPGEIKLIPGSKLQAPELVGAEEFAFCAKIKCYSAQKASLFWTDKVFVENRKQVWMFAAGGDGDYGGNETYMFDFTTLTNHRVNDPIDPYDSNGVDVASWGGPAGSPEGCKVPAMWPVGMHTYDGHIQIGESNKILVQGSYGYCFNSSGGRSIGRRPGAFLYDLDLQKYTDYLPHITGSRHATTWDKARSVIYQADSSYDIKEIDPGNGFAVRKIFDNNLIGPASFEFEQNTRYLYYTYNGSLRRYHIDLSGGVTNHSEVAPGFGSWVTIHKPSGRIVSWLGGANIRVYDPDANTVTNYTLTSPLPPVSADIKPYGGFFYIEAVDAFVIVNDWGREGIFTFRLPERLENDA